MLTYNVILVSGVQPSIRHLYNLQSYIRIRIEHFNSFIEIYFTYLIIYSFRVYNSMFFSIFAELWTITTI